MTLPPGRRAEIKRDVADGFDIYEAADPHIEALNQDIRDLLTENQRLQAEIERLTPAQGLVEAPQAPFHDDGCLP